MGRHDEAMMEGEMREEEGGRNEMNEVKGVRLEEEKDKRKIKQCERVKGRCLLWKW